jgi:pimeloyl-ACP methyl ester carboxylesterase
MMEWEERTMEVEGVGLAVRTGRVGTAPARRTLVFLHDSLGCITTWRELPQELGATLGCDVLVYDRQGYGRSAPFGPEPRGLDYMHREADVLNKLIITTGIQRAILVGHSDGGTIALLAAVRHPGRIDALVTIGAHVFVEEVTLNGIRMVERQMNTTDLRERLVRHHGDRTDALFHAWVHTWLAPFFRAWDITTELASIACPVLVLQGMDDQFGTEAQVQAIAAAVGPQTRTYIIPGAGHSPHRETPGITADLVRLFVGHVIR